MASKSISDQANENHLKRELELERKSNAQKDKLLAKLEGEIENLRVTLQAKREEIESIHESSQQKSAQDDSLSRENSRLQTQVTQLRAKISDQSVEYDLLVKKLQQEVEAQRKNHERDARELRRTLEEQRKSRETEFLSTMRREVEEQIQDVKHQNRQLNHQISALKAEISTLQSSEMELVLKVTDQDKDLRALRVDIRRAKAGLPTLSDQIYPDQADKTINSLERKVDRLKDQTFTQLEELNKTASDKDGYKQECRQLQVKLDDLQREKENVERQKADVERRLSKRIEELESKLDTKTKEAYDRDSAISKASRAEANAEDKEFEAASLSDHVQKLEEELRQTRTKYDNIIAKWRAELTEEREKVSKLEVKVHQLQAGLDTTQRKLFQEEASKKTLEEQIKKNKVSQLSTEKENEKLSTKVSKLERIIRELERIS